MLRTHDQRLAERNTGGQTGAGPSVTGAPPDVTRSPPESIDMTDEDAVAKVSAGFRRVDHGRISAGTLRNGVITHNGGSVLVPIMSSPSKVYTACRNRLCAGMEVMAKRKAPIHENTSAAIGR